MNNLIIGFVNLIILILIYDKGGYEIAIILIIGSLNIILGIYKIKKDVENKKSCNKCIHVNSQIHPCIYCNLDFNYWEKK